MAKTKIPEGHAVTAWRSEVYPSCIGKKGLPVIKPDGFPLTKKEVEQAAHCMFHDRRSVWNACLQAVEIDEERRRLVYRETGQRDKNPPLRSNESALYKIGVSENPKFVELGKKSASHQCITDVCHRSLKNAYERYFEERRKKDWFKRAKQWANRRKTQYINGQKIEGRNFEDYCKPHHKSRREANSVYLHNQAFTVVDNRLFIEKVPGSFKIAHPIPWKNVKFREGSLSVRAGRYFLSVVLHAPIEDLRLKDKSQEITGIDLGVTNAAVSATTSDEVVVHHLRRSWEDKYMKLLLKRKKIWSHRLRRRLDRAKRYGMNPNNSDGFREASAELAKIYLQLSNIKKDGQHKLTSSLIEKSACVVVENLNVKGMTKKSEKNTPGKKSLRKRILETGFFEIKRQLIYKARLNNRRLLVANQWYPSTKTCSRCGHRQKVEGSRFLCEKCGHDQHRDGNAATTLANLGVFHFSTIPPGTAWMTDETGTKITQIDSSAPEE